MKRSGREKSIVKVAIVAGGTGGHIMPALALAEALANIGRPVAVDFICGSRPVELEIFVQAGVKPTVFPVGSSVSTGWTGRLARPLGLFYSFLKSLLKIRRYDVVVGMGGYITAPVLSAASTLRIPIVLHDSNTILGKVNRIMARRAKVVACGLPLAQVPDKVPANRIREVGTPVRREILKGDPDEAAREMYLRTDAFTILISGGSLGAPALNTLMARTLGELSRIWPEKPGLQVIWSTGARHFQDVRKLLDDQPLKGQIWVAPNIERMDHAYSLADLYVGRAGGSSLAEVLLCNLPAILFPLPIAADQHQRHNAHALARHKAALVFDEERIAPAELAEQIVGLVRQPSKLSEMAQAARHLSRPDAARDLARLVIEAAEGEV
ncbi:UDP-N-acetylglucosamine--N-acetylmuramyl-(pentapeptide) pyrophosphoryl-undecaprenol N-acetylglucosamine transferase [bacterium]|nr:UDP-N-acetylglucosamine--N-acetylmuramyl-(pentapeptide) pyrophosphoryl-undecaprenol N-acetylglucosamine transferase [bacterium]